MRGDAGEASTHSIPERSRQDRRKREWFATFAGEKGRDDERVNGGRRTLEGLGFGPLCTDMDVICPKEGDHWCPAIGREEWGRAHKRDLPANRDEIPSRKK